MALDRRLTFDSHVTAVAKPCNYHLPAIRHIRHLLRTGLALTLVCSLTLSRLDYCNAVLYDVLAGSIQKLHGSFCGRRDCRTLSVSAAPETAPLADDSAAN